MVRHFQARSGIEVDVEFNAQLPTKYFISRTNFWSAPLMSTDTQNMTSWAGKIWIESHTDNRFPFFSITTTIINSFSQPEVSCYLLHRTLCPTRCDMRHNDSCKGQKLVRLKIGNDVYGTYNRDPLLWRSQFLLPMNAT